MIIFPLCLTCKDLPSCTICCHVLYFWLTEVSVFLFLKGLVVPVIRNAARMNFAEIEKEINLLAKKANDGTISIDEMAGGSFTISNGGVYGSLLSTPIINPPQVDCCFWNIQFACKHVH